MDVPSSVREKLIKLLSLSESDNDHEALLAIRTANALKKNNGLTWPAILNSAPALSSRRTDPYEHVWEMIEFIRANAGRSFDFSFIDSIASSLLETDFLTENQIDAVKRVYVGVYRRRRGR